ncbi:Up-regulated during septation-domain-containing protein [Talaromyces proteolyticus]|uniref:Up-regulated during septation-domain-containing protein n=1 Tax=Talaromyces proteolyticus TaxID=1131652 RepID=A0AAD4KXX7_9EURO|nr:Up-regulated during septation-domain-containing protein [Talaromyces proteolyticus]KAH8699303.1 Up-regulated during septation-domain-containing protein [Talaromyces proteolyticus]
MCLESIAMDNTLIPPPPPMDRSTTAEQDMELPANYVSLGLNNIVARETRVEIENNKVQFPDAYWRAGNPATERPKHYNLWPVLKKAVSANLVEGAKVARKLTETHFSTSLPATSTQSPPKIRSLSARRKLSFPELGRGIMVAGHHPRMDSPTIPGRFPVHERSYSAPGGPSTPSILHEESTLIPVSERFIWFADSDDETKIAAATPFNDKLKEAAERTPTADKTSPSANIVGKSFELKGDCDEEEKPPVPPKSPRLTTRAALNQEGRLASKYNLSSPKLPLRIDTNIAKAEPSVNIVHITHQARPLVTQPRASTAMDFYPPAPITARLHKRSESASGSVMPTKTECPEKNRKPIPTKEHVKYVSTEKSIMARGRPNKRRAKGEIVTKQSISSERISFATIPPGFDVIDAPVQFPPSDVEKIQTQAKIQAQKFKVLRYDDVKAMSQELRVLDERCDYLRNTHKSLRTGRNRLHERMINFLRSPRSTINYRENMLRQGEALAELDRSIDEWINKLEQVEHRRTCVRQKLLEHVAASLILSATASSQGPPLPHHTPPQSPFNSETGSDAARESIKIYADSGVYADADIEDLLADIQRQMDDMSPSRDPSPCLESAVTA